MKRYKVAIPLALLIIIVSEPFPMFAIGQSATLYQQQIVPNAWVAAGNHFNLTGDDAYKNYVLPWPFPFYDNNYTNIWISTNGLITFGSIGDLSYQNSEQLLAHKLAIAPLWRDLVIDPSLSGNSSDVYIGLYPDADHVLIRWAATLFANYTRWVNFEAVLGRDASIEFNYGPSNATRINATVGISDGSALSGDYFTNTIQSSNNIDSYLYTVLPGSRPIIRFFTNPSLNRPSPSSIINATYLVGENVVFNGSASYDRDGYIASYLWNFGDGSPNATTAIATHAFNFSGVYKIMFRVMDNSSLVTNAVFTAKVSFVNATLTDGWPETQFLRILNSAPVSLNAVAINLGNLPVWARVGFTTTFRNGTMTTAYSQIAEFSTRDVATFVGSFALPLRTARYSFTVTISYTPRDPGLQYPGWQMGGTATFWIRVIAPS